MSFVIKENIELPPGYDAAQKTFGTPLSSLLPLAKKTYVVGHYQTQYSFVRQGFQGEGVDVPTQVFTGLRTFELLNEAVAFCSQLNGGLHPDMYTAWRTHADEVRNLASLALKISVVTVAFVAVSAIKYFVTG